MKQTSIRAATFHRYRANTSTISGSTAEYRRTAIDKHCIECADTAEGRWNEIDQHYLACCGRASGFTFRLRRDSDAAAIKQVFKRRNPSGHPCVTGNGGWLSWLTINAYYHLLGTCALDHRAIQGHKAIGLEIRAGDHTGCDDKLQWFCVHDHLHWRRCGDDIVPACKSCNNLLLAFCWLPDNIPICLVGFTLRPVFGGKDRGANADL